jgi:hypothetical protein
LAILLAIASLVLPAVSIAYRPCHRVADELRSQLSFPLAWSPYPRLD